MYRILIVAVIMADMEIFRRCIFIIHVNDSAPVAHISGQIRPQVYGTQPFQLGQSAEGADRDI